MRVHLRAPRVGITLLLLALTTWFAPAVVRADMSAIRIQEIGWATRLGDANTQFVELAAVGAGQSRDAELHLEITSGLGTTSDLLVSFGTAEGAPWANGTTWLLGGSAFNSKAGVARDGAIGRFDASEGTLTLYTFDGDGVRVDLDTFQWGRSAGLPRSPYNGQSLQRTATGFTRQAHPTPTNANGATAVEIGYGYDPQTRWVIDEALFACANGDRGVRFVTARSDTAQTYDPNLLLRCKSSSGGLIAQTRLFAGTNGAAVAAASRWLVASPAFTTSLGLRADLSLSALPDSLGGTLELAMPNSGGDSLTVVSQLIYGSASGDHMPDPGTSLRLVGTRYVASAPTPTNRAQETVTTPACFGVPVVTVPVWRIDEYGLGCTANAPGFWFLEIRAAAAQKRDPRVGIRFRDAAGQIVGDLPVLFGSSTASVTSGAPYLIASSAFRTATGLDPDYVCAITPAESAGRVQVYVALSDRDSIVSELVYGPSPAPIAAPPGGGSLQRSGANYVIKAIADPQRADGTTAKGECFDGVTADGIRISEVGLQCAIGTPVTFFELEVVAPSYTVDGRLSVQIYDHTGLLKSSFGLMGALIGQTLLQGRTYLLASANIGGYGLLSDLALSNALDLAGGRLVLSRLRIDGTQQVLSDVRYGTSGIAVPAGMSLQRVTDSSYVVNATPSPRNLAGATGTVDCFLTSAIAAHVDEVGTRCRDGSAQSFFQLGFDASAVIVKQIGLRVTDHAGALVMDLPGVLATRVGVTVLPGQRVLFAGPALTAAIERPTDASLPQELDGLGGTLTLYRQDSTDVATRTTITSLSYGGTIPAPAPGTSIQRNGAGVYVVNPAPAPTNVDGSVAYSECWFAPDTTVRIREIALGCYSRAGDTRYVELAPDLPTTRLDTRLRVRFLDGKGTVLGDQAAVPAALAGQIWSGGPLLLAVSGFATVTGIAPDVVLSQGPAPDSGVVQLYSRGAAGSPGIAIDEVRYGFAGGLPAPPPGGSLHSDTAGILAELNQQFPERYDHTTANGPCFAYLPTNSFYTTGVGLRCADGSTTACFVELGTRHDAPLDTSVGVEIRDLHGNVIADMTHVFASRATLGMRVGEHLLLAPASAAAVFGVAPDVTLPAPLDTVGGRIRVYREIAPGVRLTDDEVLYGPGGNVSMPPPGFMIQRSFSAANLFITATILPLPSLHRFPAISVDVVPCYRTDAPRFHISEVSPGCAFEPRTGTGVFIELRNDGPTVPLPAGLTLTTTTSGFVQRSMPLFAGHLGENWNANANWLLADEDFASLNGVTPDQLIDAHVPTNISLYWTPTPGASGIFLDVLSITSSRFQTGTFFVDFAQSAQKSPTGVLSLATLPDPTNSHGQQLIAASSCLGTSAPAAPVSLVGFARSDADGDSATAFVELGYRSAAQTSGLRLRIEDRSGAVLVDEGDLFGPAGVAPPTPASGSWGPWLIGAPGFSTAALYAADRELPLPFDPAGGTITIYQTTPPSTPAIIHSRVRFGPLLPGQGFGGRAASVFEFLGYPYPIAFNSLPMPLNHAGGPTWSRYGENNARYVSVAKAGANCPDGDARYVELSTLVTDGGCLENVCSTIVHWPKAGRVRTLDATGAALDSVDLDEPAAVAARSGAVFGPFFPVFSTGSVLASTHLPPAGRAPAMDANGGTVQFVTLDPAGRAAATVHSASYGAAIGAPSPQNAYVGPWPVLFARLNTSRAATLSACPPCTQHAFQFDGPIGSSNDATSIAAQLDTLTTVSGLSGPVHRRFRVDGTAGQSELVSDGAAEASLGAVTSTGFMLTGPGATPVSIRARLALNGPIALTRRDPSTTSTSGFSIEAIADAQASVLATRVWPMSRILADTSMIANDTLALTITVLPGHTFHLTTSYQMFPNARVSALDLTAQWVFDPLPLGMHVTSCSGFGGGPVPTALALVSATAAPDHVDLIWDGADATTSVLVERREVADAIAPWLPRQSLLADGSGRIAYRDDEVTPGVAYEYRLRRADGSTSRATAVVIPTETALRLAPRDAQPVHGPIRFVVAHPAASVVRLELFDVAGRLVGSQTLTSAARANEQVQLDPGGRASGIFLARLTCGRDQRIVRVVRTP